MRTVHVTKAEFDDMLYPAVGSSAAQNESELETALRVMRKLKDSSKTYEEDVDPIEAEKMRRQGGRLIAYKKLRTDDTTFYFEEDEWKLVLDRLKKFIPRVTLLAAEEMYDLIKRVSEAPTTKEAEMSSRTS